MYLRPHLVLLVTLICHGTSSTTLDPTGFQQPLITYRDANIGVEQLVGTPPQKLRLVVNLLSDVNGTTRIASACCAKCCNQRRFAPWKSSSFREISNDADLSVLAKDVIQFPNSVGGHTSLPTQLKLMNYDFMVWDWDKHLDGTANFGYSGKNITFLDALFNQIKPQFAIYVHRTCNDSYAVAGSVAYGTLENDGCNPFQFRALRQNEFGQVLLPLQKLSLGELVVDGQESWTAILSSDYAISMPQAVFNQLNATLRASETTESVLVDCSLNPGPLTFTFSDGVTYSIPFSQLITNVDGVCALNIDVPIYPLDTFFIGLPFLREYCIAIDYEGRQVGLATHRQSVTSECKYDSEPKAPPCTATIPEQCSATPATPSTKSQSTTPVIARSTTTTTTKSGTKSSGYLPFGLASVVIAVLLSIN